MRPGRVTLPRIWVWRRVLQVWRTFGTSGRFHSRAREPFLHVSGRNRDAHAIQYRVLRNSVMPVKFGNQVIQRQIAMFTHSLLKPAPSSSMHAVTATIALRPVCKRSSLPLQLDQVIHEPDRDPEMRSSRTAAVTLLDGIGKLAGGIQQDVS